MNALDAKTAVEPPQLQVCDYSTAPDSAALYSCPSFQWREVLATDAYRVLLVTRLPGQPQPARRLQADTLSLVLQDMAVEDRLQRRIDDRRWTLYLNARGTIAGPSRLLDSQPRNLLSVLAPPAGTPEFLTGNLPEAGLQRRELGSQLDDSRRECVQRGVPLLRTSAGATPHIQAELLVVAQRSAWPAATAETLLIVLEGSARVLCGGLNRPVFGLQIARVACAKGQDLTIIPTGATPFCALAAALSP